MKFTLLIFSAIMLIEAKLDTTQDYVILKRQLPESDLEDQVNSVEKGLLAFESALLLNKTLCEEKKFQNIDPLRSNEIPEIIKVAQSICSLALKDKQKVQRKLTVMKAIFLRAKTGIFEAVNATKASANLHMNIASIGYTNDRTLNKEIEDFLQIIGKALKT